MLYKDSGVDINKANESIAMIKNLIGENIGVYAGIFPINGILQDYEEPVLVATTDGVGTKLQLLREYKMWQTAAIDLVAMNLNDLVCMAAKPLFFLDYYATSSLNKDDFVSFIKYLNDTLQKFDCKLLGGETAELPGVFNSNSEDVAGFAVGIAEKSKIFDYSKITVGDKIIALTSSGVHSNGFSLVRKLLNEKKIKLTNELLYPTKLYVNQTLRILDLLKGAAHITGGGLTDNLPRIIPNGLCAHVEFNWDPPKVFEDILNAGVDIKEMFNVFNMGVGMVYIVSKENLKTVSEILENEFSEEVLIIGDIMETKRENDNKKIIISI
ncbi:MAG TPA: phosphoribosylformylglycinamidine cyclo-ligase [Defluviitoga sp.]|nr:phosphoribosylformylglycinamidine cyclo-ligase [Defluviitoga sp.]HOP23973.1 phosphoribosylformylglycinamidine cyclo-ligase [Defluviitoga sp.]HPZ28908.1 phosphoribosylformylglycinamidine cyclo-ligase [Defluviitoga sp.]HQD62294.1 phosphoribosylformylglycinamidine cyclo-ligase [Defluviitoga sp.]